MILRREQAITEHWMMWNWIEQKIREAKRVLNISYLKIEYLKINGFNYIFGDCFLCQYVSEVSAFEMQCNYCPVERPSGDDCLGGLWCDVLTADTWQKQAALAHQIANLPERADV